MNINRICEIENYFKLWGVASPENLPPSKEMKEAIVDENGEVVTAVDSLAHTTGELNIADLATRGTARMEDIGPGSEWQDGPAYLKQDRSRWPISRAFVRNNPREEKRSKIYKLISHVNVTVSTGALSIMDRVTKWQEVPLHA